MELLGKEAIFAANDYRTEDVLVPEWGGTVRIQGLSGEARDRWEASLMVQRGNRMVPDTANARAKLIVMSAIDEDGELLFTMRDIQALGSKSGAAMERCYKAAARLSGLDDDELDKMTRDFAQTAGNGSSSPSPNPSA